MSHENRAASATTSSPTAVETDPPPAPESGGTTARSSTLKGVVVPVVLALLVTVGLILTAPRNDGQAIAAQDVLDGRQLRIMAPANPGGGWDQTAREMQKALRDVIGRSEVVNVGGAGGTIGLSQFTQLEGDPTQLMVTGAVMVGAIESNDSPVSLADVVPIARLTADQIVIVVPTDSAIQTMQDLAAQMQADLGSVSIAGGSAGGVEQILSGLMAQALGANPAEVSYVPHSGGGEALTTVLSGAATAAMSSVSEIRPQIEAGNLRALAVSGEERSSVLADVPTLQEAGVDVVLTNWRAVMAAPGITDDQRAALEEIIREMHSSADWQATLERRGWSDAFLQGAELEAFLADEQARTAEVLEQLGLG
jgi:putative tricarboxylic transport membrane protein